MGDLGEGGNCLAGVNFGAAACARLDAFGKHADAHTGRSSAALKAAVAAELAAVFGEDKVAEELVEVYHQCWFRAERDRNVIARELELTRDTVRTRPSSLPPPPPPPPPFTRMGTAWRSEPLTWHDGDSGALSRGQDPRIGYGHPRLRQPTSWGVHWAGTETERASGHVDGAVMAGERAATEVAAAIKGE